MRYLGKKNKLRYELKSSPNTMQFQSNSFSMIYYAADLGYWKKIGKKILFIQVKMGFYILCCEFSNK